MIKTYFIDSPFNPLCCRLSSSLIAEICRHTESYLYKLLLVYTNPYFRSSEFKNMIYVIANFGLDCCTLAYASVRNYFRRQNLKCRERSKYGVLKVCTWPNPWRYRYRYRCIYIVTIMTQHVRVVCILSIDDHMKRWNLSESTMRSTIGMPRGKPQVSN